MMKQNDDCYYFYYSSCMKGDYCPFRHEEAALGNETICLDWMRGSCSKDGCSDRHMMISKNRTQTPCFWESQPGGCQKPHCVFFHKKSSNASPTKVTVPATVTNLTVPPMKAEARDVNQSDVGGASIPMEVVPTGVVKVKNMEDNPTKNDIFAGAEEKNVMVVRTLRVPRNGVKRNTPIAVVSTSEQEELGGIVLKSLEQIHRERALESMKKKKQKLIPLDLGKSEQTAMTAFPQGRKIVLKKDELDQRVSPGRKVEAAKSDNEEKKVGGGIKSRLGPLSVVNGVTNSLVKSSSSRIRGTSSDSDAGSIQKISINPVVSRSSPPQNRVLKRRHEHGGDISVSSTCNTEKMAGSVDTTDSIVQRPKPTLEVYRPPCALAAKLSSKPSSPENVGPSQKNLSTRNRDLKSKIIELPNMRSGDDDGVMKKLKRAKDEAKPLEQVVIKSLDDILEEKRVRAEKHESSKTACTANKSQAFRTTLPSKKIPNRDASSTQITAHKRQSVTDVPEFSTLHLLKRRRLSMERGEKLVKSDEDSEEGPKDKKMAEHQIIDCESSSGLPAPDGAERTTQVPLDENAATVGADSYQTFGLDDDSFLSADFLLGPSHSELSATSIKDDDELFNEIQLLLR